MLSPALHRAPDPERSRDPRVRALVARLGALDPGPAPTAHFRAELRAQLVTIAPRIVAEETPATQARRRPLPGPARDAARTGRRRRKVRLGRPLAILTCVVAVFALLLGGAVWISKRALPGDALYGLKRASENVQKAMTSGDHERATLLLGFADNRYHEVSDLLPRGSALAVGGSGTQAGGTEIDGDTAGLIKDALGSADSDVKDAMQSLGAEAIRNQSGSGLALVLGWTGAPLQRLGEIAARIPAGPLHQRALDSLNLLSAANTRAAQLHALGRCSCLARARTDKLGALPCRGCSSSAPAVPNAPGRTPNGGTPSPSNPSTRSSNVGTSGPSGPSESSESSTGAQPPAAGAAGSTPGVPAVPGLPTLPSTPNLPVPGDSTATTCHSLELGLISLGNCGADTGR